MFLKTPSYDQQMNAKLMGAEELKKMELAQRMQRFPLSNGSIGMDQSVLNNSMHLPMEMSWHHNPMSSLVNYYGSKKSVDSLRKGKWTVSKSNVTFNHHFGIC